jgi:hypothetical protein
MPGLLTLKTDLKSLKYGQDQPGGGSSGQPYIKTDINTVDSGINRLRFTKFDDGLIRGGIVGAIGASVVDTLRISKFLTDFPKGPLFIAKQIGLQLSNPELEHKVLPTGYTGTNNPTSGQGFFNNVGNFLTNVGTDIGAAVRNTANKIENKVGPTRIYNLGINTLAQVPVNALGGHIVRHGFLPNNDDSKYYEKVVTENNKVENNSNRLLFYANQFKLGGTDTISIIQKANWDNTTEITNYIAGPNSVYGIGSTRIGRYTNTNDQQKIKNSLEFSSFYAGYTHASNNPQSVVNIKSTIDYGLSNKTESIFSDSDFPTLPTLIDENKSFLFYPATSADKNLKQFTSRLGNTNLPELKNINDTVSGSGPSSYPGTDANSLENKDGVLDLPALVYNYANPALKKYSEVKQQVDKKNVINQTNFKTTPVFNDRNSPTFKYNTGAKIAFNRVNDRQLNKDEIKVIFSPIQPFTAQESPIQFLSYLTNYSENYDSDWGDVKYVGRAESFYIFKGFKKTVSLGLHVPCFNSDELTKNHAKLFKLGGKSLAYALAGQYNEDSLLGGVIIRLTVGNYLVKSPGIITSLKFDIVDGSSWDLDKKYAHILKIDINFTVIGNELPIYESTIFNELPKEEPPKTPEPPKPDPTPVQEIEIPPARDQSIGSALSGLNNPGLQPKFATPAQEEAYLRARGL